jgi:hypothetical protein
MVASATWENLPQPCGQPWGARIVEMIGKATRSGVLKSSQSARGYMNESICQGRCRKRESILFLRWRHCRPARFSLTVSSSSR